MKESDLLLLEVAHLAIGTSVEKPTFTERGAAIWEAFRIGQAYEKECAKESRAGGREGK